MKSARFIVVVLLVAGIWFAWPAVIDLIFDEPSLEGCLVNWQGAPRRAANFAVVMICITPAIVVWAFYTKMSAPEPRLARRLDNGFPWRIDQLTFRSVRTGGPIHLEIKSETPGH